MTLAPLTSLGLVSSHTNLLATGQRRYAIKRSEESAVRRHHPSTARDYAANPAAISPAFPSLPQLLVILRQRSLRRSRGLPTKDLCNSQAAPLLPTNP